MTDERIVYRAVIDTLVAQCRTGQGQVSARRVVAGVWNENAEVVTDAAPGQHEMNLLLAALTPDQRAVLAALFAEEFASGVYNALQVLETAGIAPFVPEAGPTASDAFLDRLDDWEWPTA
nr:hypothetical protein [Propionibacterium sp.]